MDEIIIVCCRLYRTLEQARAQALGDLHVVIANWERTGDEILDVSDLVITTMRQPYKAGCSPGYPHIAARAIKVRSSLYEPHPDDRLGVNEYLQKLIGKGNINDIINLQHRQLRVPTD
jgi:hypothetical protein